MEPFNMNARLRSRYRRGGFSKSAECKSRTGNSHGPKKDRTKVSASTPTGLAIRATQVANQRVMVVQALTGKRKFVLA